MRKFIKNLILFSMIFTIVGCGTSKKSDVDPVGVYGCDTLNVYNWGEYISQDILSDFEREYNVRVNYSLYDSNEVLYTKLLGGSEYDVLVPSDYMIKRLSKESLLQEIDWSLITNASNLYDSILNTPTDPDNLYSVPYFWGSVGILYDKTIVDPAIVKEKGFEILKDEKFKGNVFMYDSQRDSFMIALKALGYSMNTTNEQEIEEAFQWLIDLDEKVEPSYVTDEVIDAMIYGEKALAVVYSGDAAYILSENENMDYYLPESGTNMWIDAMVIPANSKCPKLAHEFINYMIDDDVAFTNSEEIGYASPNKNVIDEMIADGGIYADNSAYFPRADFQKDEYFEFDEKVYELMSELWIQIKIK
ncbi:MAG: ABC transporter substrate-binding protein [Anaerorhabdus sp.]